jgi:hypothetical protein
MADGLETGRLGSLNGIELLAFGEENREEWRDWLQRAEMHDFFQGPELHELAQREGEGTARLYAMCGEEGCVGLPCLIRRLPYEVGRWRWDATSVRGYPGPWLVGSDDGFIRRAFGALEELLREEGVLTVFSLLNPVLGQGKWLEGIGEVRGLGSTVAMDLDQEEESVWMQVRPSHRRGIRRLNENGLWCGPEDLQVGMAEFVKAYEETMDRVGAGSVYRYGESFFRELCAVSGDSIHLWLARLGGRDGPVAGGALFGEGAGIAEYYLSGTRNESVQISPAKALLDAAWRWGRERGWRYLHLGGGVGREDSLFEFKAGFSPCRFPMGCWSWVLDQDAYRWCCDMAERDSRELLRHDFFPRYRSPMLESRLVEKVGGKVGGEVEHE